MFDDVVQCLPEAFGRFCNDGENGARFKDFQRDQSGIADALSKTIEERYQWLAKYGFTITKVSGMHVEYDEASKELIAQAQKDDLELRKQQKLGAAYSGNMAGMMAAASASAMNTAAGNENGAMMGFMGMNMANMQANNLMGAATNAVQNQQPAQQPAPVQDSTTKLLEMKKLLDAGAITQEEYDAVKKQVLGL
jgi:membrane protease subunit (stomatin/prohibitin family)